MGKELKISFLGDICPINRVEDAVLTNNFSNFDAIGKILNDQDLVIANLECPLTESRRKIDKIGPNLKAHPKTINLLKHLNIGIVALANNHILDYDDEGLSDTLKLLNENKIDFVGAGLNIEEARKPLIKIIKGIKICLINICEREFNIAGAEKAGANPFDIISLLGDIKEYRDNSDLMILFYHGGVESYNLPTPEMFRNFRFLAEKGIDIIVCNHQHVFSGYQKLAGSHIFYGLGNFIFDWPSMTNDPWNYGIALNLTIKDKESVTYEIVPYKQCGNIAGVIIDSDIKEKILKEFDKINSELTEDFVEKKWEKFVFQENKNLLANLCIQNRYLRYIFRKTGLIKILITRQHVMRLYNYFNCQSHSELIRDSLKKEIKN
jgi:hypothetical protein